ncbi:hypothetical protein LPJ73_000464 [Coemansia sp. RSA 2703]|nr:hypothetical protein LPJ73_000464 [Coemansia sp. RSA 2703]KAJ2378149.1 hypothetical protein IW150_000969 [Coemansia sp. RSA 2607]KAJ2398204.1 hypothetical protein GGI05_000223 [Coemansia sp. RSA 2603]
MSTYREHPSNLHGDPGQSSNAQGRTDGNSYGYGKQNDYVHPHHRSAPDMHPNHHNEQRYEGRQDEYEKQNVDQPYHGYDNRPPEYNYPRDTFTNRSMIEDGTRGLKDFFYKKPPADYSGVYGADYQPEISQKRREQDYPRYDGYTRGGVTYSDDVRSYGDDTGYYRQHDHRHYYDYNPYR